MKHTPGPWKVYEDDFGEILIEYKDGVVVDRVGTLVSNDERDNEILRADARLIAAAPLLLEALKLVLYREETGDLYNYGLESCEVEEIKRAIAAATE